MRQLSEQSQNFRNLTAGDIAVRSDGTIRVTADDTGGNAGLDLLGRPRRNHGRVRIIQADRRIAARQRA